MSKQERHGRRYEPEYQVWLTMKARCSNPRNKLYCEYGGRGITVCSRWSDSYTAFIDDMGRRPDSSRWTIERIDNSRGYSPENCKWATSAEQSRNKRNNRYYEFDGKSMLLIDWARELGMNYWSLRSRISYGMTFEQAISLLPNQKRHSKIVTIGGISLPFSDMARSFGINPRLVRNRIRKGWGLEAAFTTPVQSCKPAAAC